ncbi:hypothetical protein FGG08_007690, partial [Glutinoglossum americanum]
GDCMINAEPGSLHTIRFAEKGTLRITFIVRTAGAHGAYVHRTESASRLAAALIARLAVVETMTPNLPPDLAAHMARADVRSALDAAMGQGAADIATRPTLNIGVVQAGLKVNMIPDHCRVEADIRLPMGLTAEQVLTVVAGILKDFPQIEMSVQEAASNPAAYCAHNHRMVGLLAGNAEAVTGTRPIAVPSLGATDCKFWRYRNVPAYVYGPAPGRMAMTNESVPVSEPTPSRPGTSWAAKADDRTTQPKNIGDVDMFGFFGVSRACIFATVLGGLVGSAAAADLKVALSTNLNTLDPATATFGEEYVYSGLVFSALMGTDPEGKVYPDLAVSSQASADLKSWDFKLRPSVRFQH